MRNIKCTDNPQEHLCAILPIFITCAEILADIDGNDNDAVIVQHLLQIPPPPDKMTTIYVITHVTWRLQHLVRNYAECTAQRRRRLMKPLFCILIRTTRPNASTRWYNDRVQVTAAATAAAAHDAATTTKTQRRRRRRNARTNNISASSSCVPCALSSVSSYNCMLLQRQYGQNIAMI